MSHSQLVASLAFSLGVACLFPSCRPDEDPGIREKMDLLEAEIRERDLQIAAMQEEDEPASKPDSSGGAPDLDAARGAYLGFVETLRGKLVEAMPGAKFERTSVFPVEGPDPSRPILSKVAFRIVGKDGRVGEILIPLFAGPSGEWELPDAAEIAASFKPNAEPAAVAAKTPAQVAPEQPRSQPVDVMGASRTVEVQWPEGKRPTAPQTSQPAPAPAAPVPPALPKKVMPTTRDVIIDFE